MRTSLINKLQLGNEYVCLSKDQMFNYIMTTNKYNALEKICKFVHTSFKKREETTVSYSTQCI